MTANNWLGNALPTSDVQTISIGGTWVAGDTITITGLTTKTVTLTLGSLVTIAQVCASLQQAWSSSTFTDTTAAVAPVLGGQSIPEFTELRATVPTAATTLVLTGIAAGRKMPVLSVSKTSASGTVSIAHTVTASGPNDWGNTANWSAAAVPVTGDDVTIDRPVSIMDGLAQSAVTLNSLTVTPRFLASAQMGLAVRNYLGYEEWRATELAIGATNVTINAQSGLIKLNLGSVASTVTVYQTGTSQDTGRSAFQLRGTNVTLLQMLNTSTSSGTCDVGFGSNNETATATTIRQDTGNLVVGQNVTLTTFNNNGGVANLYCGGTTCTCGDTVVLWGGTWTTLVINEGTLYDLTSTNNTNVTVQNSATYNVDGNVAAKTITNFFFYDNATLIDSSNTAGRLTFTNFTRRGRLTAAAS